MVDSRRVPSVLRLHPRLLMAASIGIAAFLVLRAQRDPLTASLVAWNAGCWSWIAMMSTMMVRQEASRIQKIASEEDVGAWLALAFICISAVVSIAAIVFELANAREGPRLYSPFQYALTAATVMGSWIAVGLAFTSHYAHVYYTSGRRPRPLRFPEDPPSPGYWDFLYFAFTISVAAQTSDVLVVTSDMRKLVVAHSVLGFLFNAAIIGFTINVFAGAVGR
ncbi:MAG TPA: DUF1345 domain-containing protein [Usitatibacter sp.]|jgi:uncharacterized membrane protein|nr:DUF1345 domain-containing protein [Usitatibacter sp.]